MTVVFLNVLNHCSSDRFWSQDFKNLFCSVHYSSVCIISDFRDNLRFDLIRNKNLPFLHVLTQESAPADLQSPLTSESVNGTDDERLAADANQHADTRAEPSQNALPFSHR